MKRVIALLFLSLIPVFVLAQRTEGTANAHLNGRNVVGTLPRPSYNAQLEGIVVVQVKVDQYGNVTEAVPGVEGTTVADSGLWNTARNAAMKVHFNAKADAPVAQTGTIIYEFVAQNESVGTIRFLGIPVDGSKEGMISQLKEKGFSYNSYFDELTGEFNGKDVTIYIRTHHGLVDRVCVVFPSLDKRRVIREYNSLLSQFEVNDKYMAIIPNSPIPISEDISYEMSVHNKTYSSRFSYISPDLFSVEEAKSMRKMLADIGKMGPDEVQSRTQALCDSLANSVTQVNIEQTLSLIDKLQSIISGWVWFTIHEDGSQYQLVLYYDNLHNRPHGEDL